MKNIKYATPPKESLEEMKKGVDMANQHEDVHLAESLTKAAEKSEDYAPHACYSADLNEIAKTISTNDLNLVGWRHIISNDDNHYSVEVLHDDGKHSFSEINFGTFPAGIREFLANEKAHNDIKAESELRVVRFPSLYVFAIWLHGNEDLFWVLNPAPKQLTIGSFYTSEDFFKVLAQIANERIEGEKDLDY